MHYHYSRARIHYASRYRSRRTCIFAMCGARVERVCVCVSFDGTGVVACSRTSGGPSLLIRAVSSRRSFYGNSRLAESVSPAPTLLRPRLSPRSRSHTSIPCALTHAACYLSTYAKTVPEDEIDRSRFVPRRSIPKIKGRAREKYGRAANCALANDPPFGRLLRHTHPAVIVCFNPIPTLQLLRALHRRERRITVAAGTKRAVHDFAFVTKFGKES